MSAPPYTEITVKLYPQAGTFSPTSFHDMLQTQVMYPGLDERYAHILVDVAVAADGSSAVVTLHSQARFTLDLNASLRPSFATPPARVKAVDEAGNELHVGAHPAPFTNGERLAIGDQHYQVSSVSWPGRDASGIARGLIDWQQVVLVPVPNPVPALAPVAVPGGAPGTPVAATSSTTVFAQPRTLPGLGSNPNQ